MKVHLLTFKDDDGVTFAERNYADLSSEEAYEYGLRRAREHALSLKKNISFVGAVQLW
jgi:hypothetical protein